MPVFCNLKYASLMQVLMSNKKYNCNKASIRNLNDHSFSIGLSQGFVRRRKLWVQLSSACRSLRSVSVLPTMDAQRTACGISSCYMARMHANFLRMGEWIWKHDDANCELLVQVLPMSALDMNSNVDLECRMWKLLHILWLKMRREFGSRVTIFLAATVKVVLQTTRCL